MIGAGNNERVNYFQTPNCNGPRRTKRETDSDEEGLPATIEVFSGLYVNENAEVLGDDFDSVFKEKVKNKLWLIENLAVTFIILYLDAWWRDLCVAEKFCNRSFYHRLMPDACSCSRCSLHNGKTTRQELNVQLWQFNLQWAIYKHSLFTHKLKADPKYIAMDENCVSSSLLTLTRC